MLLLLLAEEGLAGSGDGLTLGGVAPKSTGKKWWEKEENYIFFHSN